MLLRSLNVILCTKIDTKEQCLVAAQMKKDLTLEQLTDEDGHLTVEHFEVGCELVESV